MVVLEQEKRKKAQPQSPESSENRSHSDPPKKTRDLPNLNECHSCGFKIDVCTGKNKLRTLYSEWRVVLLCNKCFSSIESCKICSYCFSGTSSESLRCVQCRHSVHKSCFLKYKNVAPWSYSCLGSEFSVCVDCWIPKHVEISRGRRIRRLRKMKNGMVEKKGRVDLEKESSRVLVCGILGRSMEDVVKNANHEMEKKVKVAARARDSARKKAAAARRAVELANSTLSLVANREDSTLKLPSKMDSVKVVGSSYLTLDVRMNSSPRISKSCCLLKNTSYLDAPKIWPFGVDSSCKTSNLRNANGCDDKLYDDSLKALCEPSVSLDSLDSDSSSDMNRLSTGRSDMKTSPKDGECSAEFGVEESGEERLKEGEESSCSDRLINFSGEDSGLELDHKQGNSALHGEDRSDRYFLKYSRRSDHRFSKHSRSSDRYLLKYSRRSDRYLLKYSRRPDRYFLKYSRRNCLKPNLDR